MTTPSITDLTSVFEVTTNSTTAPESRTVRRILSYLVTAMLAVIMAGMGCATDLDAIKKYLKKPTAIIVGVVCQFAIMPTTGVMLAAIFQMPEVETLALLIVGSCPGGSLSNIATFWVGGDISLSVTMTAISSTLGLGMMPLLLFIYQEAFGFSLKVPFETIGIALSILTVPLSVGFLIKWKYPQHAKRVLKILSSIGIVTIIAVSTFSVVTYSSSFSLIPAQFACAAIFPGLGMLVGYLVCTLISLIRPLRLKHPQRRTVCLETGIQNGQLASAIIQLSQENFTLEEVGRMVLFPIIYFFSQLIWSFFITVAYQIYKRRFAEQVQPDTEESEQHDKEKEEIEGRDNTAFNGDSLPGYKQAVKQSNHDVIPIDHLPSSIPT